MGVDRIPNLKFIVLLLGVRTVLGRNIMPFFALNFPCSIRRCLEMRRYIFQSNLKLYLPQISCCWLVSLHVINLNDNERYAYKPVCYTLTELICPGRQHHII